MATIFHCINGQSLLCTKIGNYDSNYVDWNKKQRCKIPGEPVGEHMAQLQLWWRTGER